MSLTNISFKRIRPNDIPRACLPLTIANPKDKKAHKAYGIIDTGADECAFPAYITQFIGINLKEGTPKTITTGNGHARAYSHKVSIDIQGIRLHNVKVDFLPHLEIPLLGVRNFLSKFILTINYPEQKFSLKVPKAYL